jgi:hypothetical protein
MKYYTFLSFTTREEEVHKVMPFIDNYTGRESHSFGLVRNDCRDALYGWNFVAANLWTRPLPLAFGRLI